MLIQFQCRREKKKGEKGRGKRKEKLPQSERTAGQTDDIYVTKRLPQKENGKMGNDESAVELIIAPTVMSLNELPS